MFDQHLLGIYLLTCLLIMYSFAQTALITTPIYLVGEFLYQNHRYQDAIKLSSIQGKIFLFVIVVVLSNYRSLYNETHLFMKNQHILKQQDQMQTVLQEQPDGVVLVGIPDGAGMKNSDSLVSKLRAGNKSPRKYSHDRKRPNATV